MHALESVKHCCSSTTTAKMSSICVTLFRLTTKGEIVAFETFIA